VWERTYEQRAKRYRSIAAKKSQELDQVVPRSKTAVRTVNSESSKKEDALAEVVSAEVFLFNGSASSHRSILELPILVDTGSTANIIGSVLVAKLKATQETCEDVEVEYGNHTKSKSTSTVMLKISLKGGYTKRIRFLVGDIGMDVILGVPWLKTVTIRELDWNSGIFDFRERESGKRYFLQPTWMNANEPDNSAASKMPQKRKIQVIRFTEIQRSLKSAPIVARIDMKELLREVVCNAASMNKENERDSELNKEIEMIKDPRLSKLLGKFKEQFRDPLGLPIDRIETMQIKLIPNAAPPRKRGVAKLSIEELSILKEKIRELLQKGFIRPSTSQYGSSILFIKKSDGTMRLCVDYRGLNEVTVKDLSPIPNVSEIRGQLVNAKVFSKFDLRDGYYNVRITPEDIHKTAFVCRYGHYEFTVVPFGLTNAPAIFCAMMNRILAPYLDVFAICYLDDVIVYSSDKEEHYRHLELIFKVLEENRLALKLKKCAFFQENVDFCGHDISKDGLTISKDKSEAMRVRPRLSTRIQVRSWLGACGWFQEFIPDYSAIAAPLTALTRKGSPWIWGSEHEEAVTLLIHHITSAPTLKFFDAGKKT
jgi:hypothetical protein